jgi:hypothetical protein
MLAESKSSAWSLRRRVRSAFDYCSPGRVKLFDISLRQGSAWYCDAPAAHAEIAQRATVVWYIEAGQEAEQERNMKIL